MADKAWQRESVAKLHLSVKAVLLAKLREDKYDLNKLKREIKRVASPDATQAAYDELLEAGMVDMHAVSSDQRERMAMSVERLTESSDRITQSRPSCSNLSLAASSFFSSVFNSQTEIAPSSDTDIAA
ncbi:hypothetical protein ACFX13_012208 [Malus domestica]|uniref:vesicle transport v-SNARE 12-like n=1 Tax=Malus domestica TaxID=3750 RepID=UPI0010A9AA77|nr:vesicle transport v-SNARE 12-like [Malus domestica]